MYQTPEQLLAINRSNLEAAMRVVGITLQSVEKLVELQLATAKTALAESATNVRALAQSREPKDLALLRDRMIQPSLESAQAYARGVYDVAASTQTEFSKLVEAQIAGVNKALGAAIDKLAKSAPSGSEFAVSAMRSAVAGTSVAFDTMTKVVKQVAEIGQANIAAATQSTLARKKSA